MTFSPIRPMLNVRDLESSVDFYRDVLGFTVRSTWGHDPDAPTWADLEHEECCELMLTSFWAGADGDHGTGKNPDDGPEQAVLRSRTPMLTGSLYVNVADVDALAASLEGKVTLEWGPETFAYGMREIGLRDADGYLLIFGTSVE